MQRKNKNTIKIVIATILMLILCSISYGITEKLDGTYDGTSAEHVHTDGGAIYACGNFTALSNANLTIVSLFVNKDSGATGTFHAYLYNSTGSPSTQLADIGTLDASAFQLTNGRWENFTGGGSYNLVEGTEYYICSHHEYSGARVGIGGVTGNPFANGTMRYGNAIPPPNDWANYDMSIMLFGETSTSPVGEVITQLVSPANLSVVDIGVANFTYNVTSTNSSLDNCKLYIDGILEATNSTPTNNTDNTFYGTGITYGDHFWSVNCYDTQGHSSNTTNRTIRIVEDFSSTINVSYTGRVGSTIALNCSYNNPTGYSDDVTYRVNNTNDGVLWESGATSYVINNTDLFDNLTFECFVNATYINSTSNKYTMYGNESDMLITFNVLDYNSALISSITMNLETGQEYTNNPISQFARTWINETFRNTTIVANITDETGLNRPLGTNITFNETNQQINITLTASQLSLSFWINSTETINASGSIRDENRTRWFQNETLVVIQQDLKIGDIHIRFANGTNFTQFYEYQNDGSNHVTERMLVLLEPDKSIHFQVLDYSNSPLEYATIRAYSAEYIDSNTAWTSQELIGQRLTGDDGYTFFIGDSSHELYIEVSKTGYQTERRLIALGDEDFTRDDPKIINLRSTDNTSDEDVWYFVEKYVNKSNNIEGIVFAKNKDTIEITTTYRQAQGLQDYDITGTEDDLNRYTFTLYSGIDYSASNSDDIILLILADGINVANVTIEQENIEHDTFNSFDTLDSTYLKPTLIIGIILISAIIGMTMKNRSAGGTAFRIMGILLMFINFSMFGLLAFINIMYYIIKGIRGVIKE